MAKDFFSLSSGEKEIVIQKFNDRVLKDESGCWLWQGEKNSHGYGRFRTMALWDEIKDEWFDIQAHRLSWIIYYNSPLPSKLLCCHSCDVKTCVRPEHIFVGTVQHNNKDIKLKGRKTGRTKGSYTVPVETRLKIAEEILSGKSSVAVAKAYKKSLVAVNNYLKSKEVVEKYGNIDLSYRSIRKNGGKKPSVFPSLI